MRPDKGGLFHFAATAVIVLPAHETEEAQIFFDQFIGGQPGGAPAFLRSNKVRHADSQATASISSAVEEKNSLLEPWEKKSFFVYERREMI